MYEVAVAGRTSLVQQQHTKILDDVFCHAGSSPKPCTEDSKQGLGFRVSGVGRRV